MDDIEGKRVFDDRAGDEELVVAADVGVLSVSVSAGRVGRFGVVSRCSPTDVESDAGHVAVATESDVLHRERGDEEFAATGFGPAVSVGFVDGQLVAASPGGRVAGRDSTDDDGVWVDIGKIDGAVRAIDARLLAVSTGVYRLPGLDYVGLEDVNDVAAAGPLAATGSGLFSLGNGWMAEVDGDVRVVGSDGERAHAAARETLFERRPGGWREVPFPAEAAIVDVAHGAVPYGVTADGAVLAEEEDGWRSTPLGVGDVVGCAVG